MLTRDKELDTLYEKLYEEKILENLSEERFQKLSYKYEYDGYGLKAVARMLNDGEHKTPAYYQDKLLSKRVPCTWPEIAKRGIWINSTVKRVLMDEICTGTC